MRISQDPKDKGYTKFFDHFKVTLDGVIIHPVPAFIDYWGGAADQLITADTDIGMCVVLTDAYAKDGSHYRAKVKKFGAVNLIKIKATK